jgi:hypothetical protein
MKLVSLGTHEVLEKTERRVTKRGIIFRKNQYIAEELLNYIGKKVVIATVCSAYIMVYSEEGSFICIANRLYMDM